MEHLGHQIDKISTLHLQLELKKIEQKCYETQLTVCNLILHKDEGALQQLIESTQSQLQELNETTAKIKKQINAADAIVKKYTHHLPYPIIQTAPDDYSNEQAKSPEQIITATGKFDPKYDNFNHYYHKLITYGQANYFVQSDYINAMTYAFSNEELEALISMTEDDNSLEYILKYFIQVYSTKRSVTNDISAVQNLTRAEKEDLQSYMARANITVDRIEHLYQPEAWKDIKEYHLRNTLFKVLTEPSQRKLRLTETKSIEKLGLKLDITQLLEMAQTEEEKSSLQTHIASKSAPTEGQLPCEKHNQLKAMSMDIVRTAARRNHCLDSEMDPNRRTEDRYSGHRIRSQSPQQHASETNRRHRRNSISPFQNTKKSDRIRSNSDNYRYNRHQSWHNVSNSYKQKEPLFSDYNHTRHTSKRSKEQPSDIQMLFPNIGENTQEVITSDLKITITPIAQIANINTTPTEKYPNARPENNTESEPRHPGKTGLEQADIHIDHQLQHRQQNDKYFGTIYKNHQNYKDYRMENKILFKKIKKELKIVLPSIDLVEIIKTLKNTTPRPTNTEIRQKILDRFHVNTKHMNELLQHQ